MKVVAPQVYPELVELKAFELMIGLLSNDNCGNILASCILLAFEELTHGDIYGNQDKPAVAFVNLLVKYGAVEAFVCCFLRFSEYDDVVYRALRTIAHMIFLRPYVAEIVGKQTKLINWVFDALRDAGCDYKKQYAAGFLTTLLQSTSMDNILELGQMGTVEEDMLDHDEELDLVESLFDCLFCLLFPLENKERFADDAGGVHIMIQIVYITHETEEIEGHLISLIASLTHGTTSAKKYILLDNKVAEGTKHLEGPEVDQSELYYKKLQYGLPTLQSIAVILAYLRLSKKCIIRAIIEKQMKALLDIILAYRDNIGNAGESVEIAAKTVINEYIDSLKDSDLEYW
ncbi:hypothetical protein MKX01_000580 [Papaver californicum]|nr:hypothetical protein MKX01_000580 [Papaver californicum]